MKNPGMCYHSGASQVSLPKEVGNPLQWKIGTGPEQHWHLYQRRPPMTIWVFRILSSQMIERHEHRPGHRLIFRPWIKHPKTGRRVYPKRGRFFPIWIKCNAEQLPLIGLN